jgi:putative ABC transport system permease protein
VFLGFITGVFLSSMVQTSVCKFRAAKIVELKNARGYRNPRMTHALDARRAISRLAAALDPDRSRDPRLRRGRWFADRDILRASPVVVINDSLARRDFAGEDPVGQRIRYGNRSLGVVGDVKYRGLQREDEPAFYQLTSQQAELWDLWLLVRVNSHARGQIAAVRQALRAVDPNVPVDRLATMAEATSESLSLSRFRSLLMTAFATTALLLAAIGIYGVVAYAVAKRTKEIARRMALGATPSGVIAMVLSQASQPVVAGIVGGTIGASILTRVLDTVLFGVTASDPLTFAGAVAALSAVAAAACFVPALRASSIDPLVGLRNE